MLVINMTKEKRKYNNKTFNAFQNSQLMGENGKAVVIIAYWCDAQMWGSMYCYRNVEFVVVSE